MHCTHHLTREQTIIKYVLPAHLLETSTFSGVSFNSLKTQIVLSHRRVLTLLGGSAVLPTSSSLPAMACVTLRDLIVASCNGSQATECGRPSWQPQRRSVSSYKCSCKVNRAKCDPLRLSGSSFMTLEVSLHSRTFPPETLPASSFRGFRLPGLVAAKKIVSETKLSQKQNCLRNKIVSETKLSQKQNCLRKKCLRKVS